jgi:hypothetical protein
MECVAEEESEEYRMGRKDLSKPVPKLTLPTTSGQFKRTVAWSGMGDTYEPTHTHYPDSIQLNARALEGSRLTHGYVRLV